MTGDRNGGDNTRSHGYRFRGRVRSAIARVRLYNRRPQELCRSTVETRAWTDNSSSRCSSRFSW
ncbi:hypothetical protein BN903_121 [Halorubrum sp. AJ67]|nr:hypothetical protein BN903_121 [Halorubrum sp. AJ67]